MTSLYHRSKTVLVAKEAGSAVEDPDPSPGAEGGGQRQSAPPSSLHPQGCHLAPLPPVAPVPCCRQALAPDLIRGLRRNLFLLEAVAFRVRKVSSTLPPWLKMSWGWWPGCLGRRRSRGGNSVTKTESKNFLDSVFFSPRIKILLQEVQPSRLVLASSPFGYWIIICIKTA